VPTLAWGHPFDSRGETGEHRRVLGPQGHGATPKAQPMHEGGPTFGVGRTEQVGQEGVIGGPETRAPQRPHHRNLDLRYPSAKLHPRQIDPSERRLDLYQLG